MRVSIRKLRFRCRWPWRSSGFGDLSPAQVAVQPVSIERSPLRRLVAERSGGQHAPCAERLLSDAGFGRARPALAFQRSWWRCGDGTLNARAERDSKAVRLGVRWLREQDSALMARKYRHDCCIGKPPCAIEALKKE